MNCPYCDVVLPNDCKYCTSCGKDTTNRDATVMLSTRKIDPLLAEANLHRIRGEWSSAEACCVEVMRMDPSNADAHSLLGDIYRDQNRLDDASQWYRLALDLNPESKADKAKLSQIEREQARQLINTAVNAQDTQSPYHGTQKLAGMMPSSWFKSIWVVVGIFVVVVAIILLAHPRNTGSSKTVLLPSGTIPGSDLTSPTRVPPSDLVGYGTPVSSAPNAIQSSPAPPIVSSAPPTVPPTYTALSEREYRLYSALSRLNARPAVAGFLSVRLDSRVQTADLVLALRPPTPDVPADRIQETVLLEAVTAAQTAFTADTDLRHIIVSIRMATPAGRAEPYFEGNIDQATAGQVGAGTPLDKLQQAFTDAWWAVDFSKQSEPPSQ